MSLVKEDLDRDTTECEGTTVVQATTDVQGTEEDKSTLKGPLLRSLVVIEEQEDVIKGTYLGNLLTNSLKSNQVEINTDQRTQKTVARLREPRDLFQLPNDLELIQDLARWPAECQVVEQKIQHIEGMPGYPEKYYEVTGKEVQPKPAPDTDGAVVFAYNPVSAVNYFSRSSTRTNLVPPLTGPTGGGSADLKFESRFESGNLAKAIKITDSYYQLYLRTDLYTDRHTQWFYFMVENMKKNFTYRFSIVNLCKGKSLYSVGMKPVMYSTKSAIEKKLGWHRCGTNITYFRNDNGKDEDDPDNTYTLSFQVEFPHEEDCVFLAHSYPYTYSNLQQYLNKLQNHPSKSLHTSLKPLCKTLAGNNVYILTITDPPDDDEPTKKKKGIVITGRVHPGETPSSYMVKGLIDFLTSDSLAAKELRGRFIFKIVPMLNPDGVIVGNSRCSLSGRDLNRQYRTVIRETYPPVCYTKLMIRRLMDAYGVALYCDFHAHSSKHNVFIYGCENKRSQEKRLQEQVFPLMLHKNSSDKFSFENCKFRVQKNKEGTGRVVMWMLGIENSYTLEASFSGSTLGLRSCTHFTTMDYELMGKSFCETLLDFIDDSPIKVKVSCMFNFPPNRLSTIIDPFGGKFNMQDILRRMFQLKLRSKILLKLQKEGSNADEPANVSVSDYSSDDGELSELSDEERRRKKEEACLTAPPPSPEPLPLTKTKKEGSPKLHRHPPIIINYSPPAQRKILQIPRATINLECSESSCGERLAEEAEDSRVRGAAVESSVPSTKLRIDNILMPPELVITSTQGNDLTVFERLYKCAQQPKEMPKSPLRRESCKRSSPRRSKPTSSPGDGSEGDSRHKCHLHLRQQFWKVISNRSEDWSNSTLDQDQILKACSDKLTELKRRHKLRKLKHAENAVLSVPKLFLESRRLQRKSRSFTIGRSFSFKGDQDSSSFTEVEKPKLKKDLAINDDQKEESSSKKTKVKGKKFRQGGIVSLATVHKRDPQEITSTDEVGETGGGKKKKKKKKLNQLHKRVKNAVSIVSITSRKANKSSSPIKYPSLY